MEFGTRGKSKASVRKETDAVSGTTVMNVQKPTPKTVPRREKEASEAEASLRSSIDSRLKTY